MDSLVNNNIKLVYKFCNSYKINDMSMEDWIHTCYCIMKSAEKKYTVKKGKYSTFLWKVLYNEWTKLQQKERMNKVSLNNTNYNGEEFIETIENTYHYFITEQIENKIFLEEILNDLNKDQQEFLHKLLNYIRNTGSIYGYTTELAKEYNVSRQWISQKFQEIAKRIREKYKEVI